MLAVGELGGVLAPGEEDYAEELEEAVEVGLEVQVVLLLEGGELPLQLLPQGVEEELVFGELVGAKGAGISRDFFGGHGGGALEVWKIIICGMEMEIKISSGVH